MLNKLVIAIDSIVNIKIIKGKLLILDKDYSKADAPDAIFNYLKNVNVPEIYVGFKCVSDKRIIGTEISPGNFCNTEDYNFILRLFNDICTSKLYVFNIFDCVEDDVYVDSFMDKYIIVYRNNSVLKTNVCPLATLETKCLAALNKSDSKILKHFELDYYTNIVGAKLIADKSEDVIVDKSNVVAKENKDLVKVKDTASSIKLPNIEEDYDDILDIDKYDRSKNSGKNSVKDNKEKLLLYISAGISCLALILFICSMLVIRDRYKVASVNLDLKEIAFDIDVEQNIASEYARLVKAENSHLTLIEMLNVTQVTPERVSMNSDNAILHFRVTKKKTSESYLNSLNAYLTNVNMTEVYLNDETGALVKYCQVIIPLLQLE